MKNGILVLFLVLSGNLVLAKGAFADEPWFFDEGTACNAIEKTVRYNVGISDEVILKEDCATEKYSKTINDPKYKDKAKTCFVKGTGYIKSCIMKYHLEQKKSEQEQKVSNAAAINTFVAQVHPCVGGDSRRALAGVFDSKSAKQVDNNGNSKSTTTVKMSLSGSAN